jgi:hypothetical protein
MHRKEVCEHGAVIIQCRCPGPVTKVGSCPAWCPEKVEEKDAANS